MKISYNDMFTNISDVAYEILEENDMFNDETDDMFSSDRTCKDVTDMIHDQKIVRKRHFAIKRDRKSTRLNSSHIPLSRMPSSA